jgi:hypothetical protein
VTDNNREQLQGSMAEYLRLTEEYQRLTRPKLEAIRDVIARFPAIQLQLLGEQVRTAVTARAWASSLLPFRCQAEARSPLAGRCRSR